MGHRSFPKNLARPLTGLLWLLTGLVSMDALAADPCLKVVFGRYCLGGDVGPLLQAAQPKPLTRLNQGNSLAVVFRDEADDVYVLAYHGRIYKVLRAYRVATQLRYDDLYAIIKDKYGPGEDQSRFPDYASTPGRRLASIRRGEGRAVHVWRPADDWHIELTWTREMGLSLAYVVDAIEAERAAAMAGGL